MDGKINSDGLKENIKKNKKFWSLYSLIKVHMEKIMSYFVCYLGVCQRIYLVDSVPRGPPRLPAVNHL
jgi:hypothetical protein